jgi:hypothetical protein
MSGREDEKTLTPIASSNDWNARQHRVVIAAPPYTCVANASPLAYAFALYASAQITVLCRSTLIAIAVGARIHAVLVAAGRSVTSSVVDG